MKKEDRKVKELLESEEVTNILEDEEMFDFFFKTIDQREDWTEYYNEPTRKVMYKYEDGMALVSCLCEAIVEAPVLDVLSLFCEIDMFKDWFPNVTSASVLKELTPSRGLYTCKQTMPWPIWARDMTFKASGMFDSSRGGGILTVIKSADVGA